jgi:uncharacterized protein (DUF58 family)
MRLVPSRRWLTVAVALAVIAPLALVWRPAALILVLIDLCWIGALGADSLLAKSRNATVSRAAPLALSVGRPAVVDYDWTNPGDRRTTLLVREQLPEPLGRPAGADRRLELRPHEQFREHLTIMPVARGRAEGGSLTIRVLGPLGLVWRQQSANAPWDVTVFPTLDGVALRALPPAARRREAGLREVRRLGAGRLFESLREWVPGDDIRLVDWKATARRGKPIARQYEDERRQQVMLMLDAGRLLTADTGEGPRLEAAITAALRLAAAAVEHDDDVGILIFADTVQRYVPPARGRRALRAVLDALAAAEGRIAESDYPGAFRYLAARSRKRALTVLFTDVIDRTASEALVSHAATLRPRHLPLAVTLRDPALEHAATARATGLQTAFERAAGEELLQAREEALAVMRGQGVLVLDVPPRGAAEAVVQRYLQLKRRGML